MSIKERLQELLNDKLATPYLVAKKTKISEPTLCRILNGKTVKPGNATVEELAKYFNINPVWFLTGKGPKSQHTISEPSPVRYDNKYAPNLFPKDEKNDIIQLLEKLIETSERNNKALDYLADIELQNSRILAKLIKQLTQENT